VSIYTSEIQFNVIFNKFIFPYPYSDWLNIYIALLVTLYFMDYCLTNTITAVHKKTTQ